MSHYPFWRLLRQLLLVLCFTITGAVAQENELREPPPGIIVHFSTNALAGLHAKSTGTTTVSDTAGGRWVSSRAMVFDVDAAAEARAKISGLRSQSGRSAQTIPIDIAAKWQAFRARMAELAALPGVSLVEPDYLGHFEGLTPAPAPNDPSYSQQWWLARINATTLWALAPQQTAIVAVIDTGVDLNHPDMAGIIDSRAYSFGDNNANVQDQLGHGAGVAGIIAANRGNGIGVAGVGVGVRLLPLKVNVGGGTTFRSSDLAQAMRYAADASVQVVNLSLTVDEETQLVADAINYAQARGVIVVAAAGNKATSPVAFPANKPGVIGVAASGPTGTLADFSSYGPEVTVAAPGVNMLSTAIHGQYASYNGTSFAAPVVAGVAASILAVNRGYPAANIAALLRASTTPLTGANYPFGNLDLARVAPAVVMQLSSSKTQFRSNEYLDLQSNVPPTNRPASFSLSVMTPWGEFFLQADNSWVLGTGSVLLGDYVWTQPYVAPIFGNASIFGQFPLAGLPAGNYEWRGRMFDQQTGQVIGTVSTLPITLLP